MIGLWEIIFLAFLWITSSFVCALFEGASRMTVAGVEYTSALEKITTCSIFTADSTLGKIVGVFSPRLWSGLLDMVVFNYPILYAEFQWLKFMIFGAITIGVVVVLALQVMKLIRGVS